MSRCGTWVFLLVLGCGGHTLGSRVAYQVFEVPQPFLGSAAGSCMSRDSMDYAEIKGFKWAVGAKLEAHATWPDRRDCTQPLYGTAACPSAQAAIVAVNPAAWSADLLGVAAEAVVNVRALGDGDGGFSIEASGDTFVPPFVLTAAKPAAIWFERARGHHYGDVVAGSITELHVGKGLDAAVAVTLRDVNGEHVCGPVPAKATLGGSVFTLDRALAADHVNLPYHIIAGTSAGEGSLQFVVGDLQATLRVIVE